MLPRHHAAAGSPTPRLKSHTFSGFLPQHKILDEQRNGRTPLHKAPRLTPKKGSLRGSSRPQGSSSCTCGSFCVWSRHETPFLVLYPAAMGQLEVQPPGPSPIPSWSCTQLKPPGEQWDSPDPLHKAPRLTPKKGRPQDFSRPRVGWTHIYRVMRYQGPFFIALAKLDERHTSIMQSFLC